MKPVVVMSIAAASLAAIAAESLGMLLPLPVSLPIPLVIPIFVGVPPALVIAAFVGIFLAWNTSFFRGGGIMPRRTTVLLVATAVLSSVYFVASWRYGTQYQGLRYTRVCCAISVALLALSSFLLWSAHRTPSFTRAVLAHTVLFVWIASYAFPYLGEMP